MMQKLIEEIRLELKELSIIVNDVESLLENTKNILPTNVHKTALGGFASQFYSGIENILKRIHKYYNAELPKGNNWHINLLDRFTGQNNFFNITFSAELIEKLHIYRRFRHYFFHGYSHNLNWEILTNGVKDIRYIFEQFENELYNQIK
ncbi:MAG: hypothetical protein N2319_06630 [Candidatus Kapabacteria bacterium]|nr:hypothetical protein [Candidatus Kapabacteria bacterium]